MWKASYRQQVEGAAQSLAAGDGESTFSEGEVQALRNAESEARLEASQWREKAISAQELHSACACVDVVLIQVVIIHGPGIIDYGGRLLYNGPYE